MTTPAVHHVVPSAEAGAVGAHIAELRRLLTTELGVRSEIFATYVNPPFEGVARPIKDYGTAVPARPDDVMIYHMAVGAPIADVLAGLPVRLIVNHHNLTPPRFFRPWDRTAAAEVGWGLRQLHSLAGKAEFGVADSTFNEGDLIAAGYRATAVAPVLFDLDGFAQPTDQAVEGRVAASRSPAGVTWLFVGRVSPNKAHHHLIRALATYRQLYDPDARLWLIGPAPPNSAYEVALRAYIDALGLGDAVELAGRVDAVELAARYRQADVFVCLSEHEGFCVPLIEAMWHRIPIVTVESSAIPETVGDAAVMLPTGRRPQPDPAAVAAAVHRVVSDDGLRAALVAAGDRQVSERGLAKARARNLEVLAPLVGVG